MKNLFRREEGAVTVDWVVLAGVIILIAGAVVAVVDDGLKDASTTLTDEIKEAITST